MTHLYSYGVSNIRHDSNEQKRFGEPYGLGLVLHQLVEPQYIGWVIWQPPFFLIKGALILLIIILLLTHQLVNKEGG